MHTYSQKCKWKPTTENNFVLSGSSTEWIFLGCSSWFCYSKFYIFSGKQCDERTWKLIFWFFINQPKKIITINTNHTKYLRSVPQETGGKINGTIYVHCSGSTDNGFGCLQTLMLCTIQVHPSARLLVGWICTGLGGGGLAAWVEGVTSLLHMNLYRTGLSRNPVYTSFLCTAHLTQLYT